MNKPSNRILIIDDNPAIHEDFRKILLTDPLGDDGTDDLLCAVLGKEPSRVSKTVFEIDSALQGQEGLVRLKTALAEGRPYSLAFVDIRMPPGWDGVETITNLWAIDPALQVVICTAYSDYSWQEIVNKLGNSDRLVILKKPFDNIEVLQLAHAMTKKWLVTRQAAVKLEDLDRLVNDRTRELKDLNHELASEIAEREQAQTAMHISEERLQRAFDACPLATAILQISDQVVVQANPTMQATLQRQSSEIVGKPFWKLGFEASEEYQRLASQRLYRGESLKQQECQFEGRDGERRRGLLWLEPFALASGPHVLALLQDVTDQAALEAQLRQSQKMEAVGHLAAGVAHDFNNLLTVIQGHVSLRLKTATLDRKVADSLAAVHQASERAADLTRQLLAFSRKQVMEKGPLGLPAVVTNISAMLGRLIPENIQLQFSHATEQLTIHGDRCNIEQVLLNLVVNARDALPHGGSIEVSTEFVNVDAAHVKRSPDSRPGEFACLQVRDNGVGMNPEIAAQIFEPFFTTKETGKGTGMGLATVHGIINQHDGWVEVQSEVGRGTTFRVYFPIVTAIPVAATPWQAAPSASIEGNTVLLVEDNDDVRLLARHVLEESGVRVFEAVDGPAALAMWEQYKEEINLLITDMVMPGGLSGADLAERILAERPDLPVIFSSGYSVNLFSDDRRFRKDVNYLPKPYLASDLVAIVSAALSGTTQPLAVAS